VRKRESPPAASGKRERIARPEARPGSAFIELRRKAQRVGPKLDAAHANPIKTPLMVEVSSGATLCPMTIFAACPPFTRKPASARKIKV
jgi:hypothetical protein